MVQYAAAVAYDDLLVALATWVLRGCALWAVLIVAAAVLEAGTRGRVRATSWVATPPAIRRALLAGLGVLLAGALPGPVSAAITIGSSHRPGPYGPASEARHLPVPERPVGDLRDRAVTVRAGDTLWHLAAAHMPRRAAHRQVLDAVHRWHARNRSVIGADPDLIRPGQRLVPPPRLRPSDRPLEKSP